MPVRSFTERNHGRVESASCINLADGVPEPKAGFADVGEPGCLTRKNLESLYFRAGPDENECCSDLSAPVAPADDVAEVRRDGSLLPNPKRLSLLRLSSGGRPAARTRVQRPRRRLGERPRSRVARLRSRGPAEGSGAVAPAARAALGA